MDFALVTVRVESMHFQVDMEMPAKMRIKELVPKLLEVLKNYDESRFSDVSSLNLSCNNTRLNEDASLADYQIWDGSILDITM